MNILSRDDLKNQLKKREFAPVYTLFGAETYLRDLAAKTITEMVLADSTLREFNETEFSLGSLNQLRYAFDSAEQLPMISAFRVILVTNVVVSANSNKDTLREEDEDILIKYLDHPSKTSIVIFLANELDKRRKISKLLLSKSVSVEFAELSDNELEHWAKTKLRELNTQADEKALRHLVALTGNNVRRLTNEIEKLSVAALPDTLITFELVESLVPNSRELSNFELTDYLLSKNKVKALEILQKILDDGAEPLMLLGLIAGNFHRLLMSKELMGQGVERKEVARIMKLPWGKQEDFLATARRADSGKLTKILQRISETDLAIKTSKATPRLQIEMLVCELAAF
ncbi:MAG: DNA polymerase III subunit delta [Acidobacteria bacterium]|jgi:DNA polymerase-3 subunit delta|nr:DNA polymerase III subunit delta [Acidobacteriota bacterium]